MHDTLIQYIGRLCNRPLTDDEREAVRQAFTLKKLRKHQYFLQEGEVCKLAGFIVKGALKQYVVDQTGKENILGLYIENWWAGDRESFLHERPSPYCIDACEDTEMLVLTKEAYQNHLIDQAFVTHFTATLSHNHATKLLRRLHAVKTLSAEQRLAEFEQDYPDFMQRFPQHLIASYLGMTKETLSRIRANQLKK